MVRNLSPENFHTFGSIVPHNTPAERQYNCHSIALPVHITSLYEATSETWLACESGSVVLSVSGGADCFQDFSLDQPVLLRQGIRFGLTAFQGKASVRMAAICMPVLLETGAEPGRFVTVPSLKVTSIYTVFCQEKEQGFLMPGVSHPGMTLTYVDRESLHTVS